MTSPERKPADYVTPKLGPERIERMWDAIEHRPARSRSGVWLAAGALVAAAALLLFWQHAAVAPEAKAPAAGGDVIETTGLPTSLALPDGSKLAVAQSTRLAVLVATPAEVRLRLEHGTVDCDVARRPERQLVIEALDTLVRVKGTRFAVDVARDDKGERVAVRVARGRVEVSDRAGHVHATLGAGQAWSSATPAAAAHDAPATEGSDPVAPPEARERPAQERRSAPDDDAAEALALFESASAARIAGRSQEAAATYDKLRTRFPSDARAGLAAFESARIHLDALGDPKRALAALDFALSHRRAGLVAEDVEALRVDALAHLGDAAACARARDAFLAAYPSSAHAHRVGRACRDR